MEFNGPQRSSSPGCCGETFLQVTQPPWRRGSAPVRRRDPAQTLIQSNRSKLGATFTSKPIAGSNLIDLMNLRALRQRHEAKTLTNGGARVPAPVSATETTQSVCFKVSLIRVCVCLRPGGRPGSSGWRDALAGFGSTSTVSAELWRTKRKIKERERESL